MMQNFFHLYLYLSFLLLKLDFKYSSLSFVRFNCSKFPDKRSISWQNFAHVGLQHKFAFRIRPEIVNKLYRLSYDISTSKSRRADLASPEPPPQKDPTKKMNTFSKEKCPILKNLSFFSQKI